MTLAPIDVIEWHTLNCSLRNVIVLLLSVGKSVTRVGPMVVLSDLIASITLIFVRVPIQPEAKVKIHGFGNGMCYPRNDNNHTVLCGRFYSVGV